jgi:N-ethylmaleimide reductase
MITSDSDQEKGNKVIEEGYADLAYGKPYIPIRLSRTF